MKKIALALAALWAAFFIASIAHAQSTRSQLFLTFLNPCVFANSQGLIVEGCVYNLHSNEIGSFGVLADANAWTGVNTFTNPSSLWQGSPITTTYGGWNGATQYAIGYGGGPGANPTFVGPLANSTFYWDNSAHPQIGPLPFGSGGVNGAAINATLFGAGASNNPLQIVQYFIPQNYGGGAAMDCSTNDAAAVKAADTAAAAVGGAVYIAGCYEMGTNETLNASYVFSAQGGFNVGSGKTITLAGNNINAYSTQQIFIGSGSVVISNAPFVSVDWWGAGVAADACPALNAAIGSYRTYFIPPGTYTCRSYVNGYAGGAVAASSFVTSGLIYQIASAGTTNFVAIGAANNNPGTVFTATGSNPPGTGTVYGPIVSALVFYNGQSNFQISGYGATIQSSYSIGPAGGCSCGIYMNNNQNFQVMGLTMVGSKSGLGSSGTNDGFVNHNAIGFRFQDVTCAGNYGSNYGNGGGTDAGGGTCVAGDFEVNGRYENMVCAKCGIMFDLAFINNVWCDQCSGIGANQAGSSSGGTGFGHSIWSVIYDSVAIGYNTLPAPYNTLSTSTNYGIVNSHLENTYVQANIVDGSVATVSHNFIVGGNTTNGFGVYFATNHTSTAPSNVAVDNNVITGNNYGVAWIAAGAGGSTPFNTYTFEGDQIQGSGQCAFYSDDSTGTEVGNVGYSPSTQFRSNTTNICPYATLFMNAAPTAPYLGGNTQAVSCPTGSPSASFRVVNGQVVHC